MDEIKAYAKNQNDFQWDSTRVGRQESLAKTLPPIVSRGSIVVERGKPHFKGPPLVDCPRCQSKLSHGTATLIFRHAPAETQKQQVEAWVCSCGEFYVPGEIAKAAYIRAFQPAGGGGTQRNESDDRGRSSLGPCVTKTIEIVDRGRGPQLSTCRITVQDVVPYLQNGSSYGEIVQAMPILSVAEIQAIERYVAEHKAEVMDEDRRIREENAGRKNPPEVEAILAEARAERPARAEARRRYG